MLPAHFLGEFRLADIAEMSHNGLVVVALALLDNGDERTQTDPCRTQVVYLVDLEAGVELAEAAEYLLHLVGGYCVQTAAEAVQLNQLQAVVLAHDVSRSIQP